MSKFTHYEEIGDQQIILPKIAKDKKARLEPGIYMVGVSMEIGMYFTKVEPKTDELISIPNSLSETVVNDIGMFLKQETREKFKKYGMVHKRGILMYGPGGTGKTSTIVKISQEVMAMGGVVLFGPEPHLVSKAIKAIKEIEDVPVVVVYEELETWLQHDSHAMLSLLDGELQNDGVVVLATTNYISRIPARVKNRPSRFAITIEMGVPNKEFREEFFKRKLHTTDMEMLPAFVDSSDGFVADQMKDLIISVCCLNQSMSDAVLKIKAMRDNSTGVEDYQEEYTTEVFSTKTSKGKAKPLRGI